MNQEQLQYVKDQLQKNIPTEQVRENLLTAGYSPALVEELLQAAEGGAEAPPATRVATLPSVGTFLNKSWAVIKQRPDVTWQTVAIVTGLALLIPVLETVLGSGGEVDVLISVVSLITAIVSVMLYIAILYVFFSDTSVSLGEGMRWASKNFWPYIWIAILSGLIGIAGFMLFIIPGIIVGIYLMLAPVVWLREDIRGVNALVRSTNLIQGHWWAVFGRYLLFILSVFLLMAVAGLVIGIIGTSVGLSVENSWIEVLTSAVSGLVLVAGVGAIFQIYQGLKDSKPAFVPEQHSGLRTFYIVTACLSPVIIVITVMFLLAAMLPFLFFFTTMAGV